MEWRVCGATYWCVYVFGGLPIAAYMVYMCLCTAKCCCVYVFGGLAIGSYIVCIVFVSQKPCTCVFVCQKQLEDSNRVFWHMLDLVHASLAASLASALAASLAA